MDAQLMLLAGPREAEAALLAELDRLAAEARRDPRLLAEPVRVVVPSRSLQSHLARALVREHAVAGIALHTLHGLAREVIDRCGESLPAGEALFSTLARRAAREEPALRSRFDALQQGYGVVEAVVSDLIDAGFDESLLAPVDELLLECVARGDALELARAVVRTAARTREALHAHGVGHRSLFLQRARACIERDPARALPSRAVLVHGFADATGTASDLLAALVSHCDARVYFDAGPAPSDGGSAAHEFSERLIDRLAGLAASEIVDRLTASSASPASLALVAAPGAGAEVRAVADRVVKLLAQGAAPESIAVVSRDLSTYTTQLRLQLGRAGVPFSGVGSAGPPGRAARRARALCALVQAGVDAPLDDWFEALGDGALAGPSGSRARNLADLRLASRVLGLRRLADLAALDVPRTSVVLPVRLGLRPPGDAKPSAHAPHLRVAPERLSDHVERARALCSALESWPESAALAQHLARLHALLAGALGWAHAAADREHSCETPILEQLQRLEADAPRDFALSFDEFVALLEKQLEEKGDAPLGGRGGGIQILSVMEARARCFDHLFVLGLNRDVFPRPVSEDALLPDAIRRPLGDLLPELPIKRRGYDEERFLFAQLLASSPHVTLSWQFTSDEGRERAPSTLLERLRWARPELPVERAPALHAFALDEPELVRSGRELALAAGLHGSSEERQRTLRVALSERRDALGCSVAAGVEVPLRELAEARAAVLAEFDRAPGFDRPPGFDRAPGAGPALGPYFGFIGAVRDPADPRAQAPHVTALEKSAACGWRYVLVQLLRVEEAPDPAGELPGFDGAGVGRVVHEVLERIVTDARPETASVDARGLAAQPFAVAWPADARFEELLAEAASSALRERGIDSPAMRSLLGEAARPLLHRARELEWSDAALSDVLGAECEGELELRAEFAEPGEPGSAGQRRRVRFRADRADALAGGGIRFSDYKTGAALSSAVKDTTRRKHLLRDVTQGARLQAAAYAQGSTDAGSGRYVQLGAENDQAALDAVVSRQEDDFALAFETAASALLRAIESGSLTPRLVEPNPNSGASPCTYCSVKQACLSGDSGARMRLERFESEDGSSDADAEVALRAVTQLRAGSLVQEPAPEAT